MQQTDKSNATSTEKKVVDCYQLITDKIIALLEQKTVPWRKSWTSAGVPKNLLTKRSYSGVNLLLLSVYGFEHNLFLTFNQIKTIGASVKKGEKAIPVVFTKVIEKEAEKKGETVVEKKTMLRYYNVFNVAQLKDLPIELLPKEQGESNSEIMECMQVIEGMPNKPKIEHKKQEAFYSPSLDLVNVPRLKSFKSSEDYYGTLMHELIHACGHSSRCNRSEVMENPKFGSEPYALEELVAELGSCYLRSLCGLDINDMSQNAAYIDNWLAVLKSDKRFIFKAATKAQQSVNYILAPVQTEETKESVEDAEVVEVW
jgi:antirestriction protein ArdC